MAPDGFHQRRVADADAEEEASRMGLVECLLARRHGHRIARPDVGDPGGHDQPACAREQQTGVREGLAAQGLRDPQRAVPERFDLARRLLRACGRLQLQGEGPDPDASDVHDDRVARAGARCHGATRIAVVRARR